MTTRVVIVDDDLWVRRGRAQVLSETPGIEVLAAVGHGEAVERAELWGGADVVLVDAWDHRAGFDRFPGVAVVRAIRSHQRSRGIVVIVITGHVVNDMLRLRMAEAGADFFYGHEEVADAEALAAAVVRPVPARPEAPHRRGALHPDAALDWIRDHDVTGAFFGGTQKVIPYSRRAVAHIRREVGGRAGLAPPGRLAPWRQVVAFVNRARGAELRRDQGGGPGPADEPGRGESPARGGDAG